MPEANVLYSVTAAVVAGLFVWVAVVLKSAKEPWAREVREVRADDVPLESASSEPDADHVKVVKVESAAEAKEDAKAEAKEDAKAEAKEDAAKLEADADAKEDAKADAK